MVYHFFYEVKETNGHHRVVTRTVRGTRTLRCRPTLLSLRDISPGRGITLMVYYFFYEVKETNGH